MRNWKKRMALLMAAVLVLTSVPELSAQAAEDKAVMTDKATPDLIISTCEELRAFCDSVEKGTNYEGKLVRLAADLTFDGVTPNNFYCIGAKNNIGFNGTFDGAGHTISGILQKSDDYANKTIKMGFFERINSKGVLKNLTLKDCYFQAEYGSSYHGLATDNRGMIQNCRVENCSIQYTGGFGTRIGAIVGYNEGTIDHCVNIATEIQAGACAGGIAAVNRGDIRNCWSSGRITATRYESNCIEGYMSAAGGIVGYSEGGTICNSANTGNVSNVYTHIYNEKYAGGIAGCLVKTTVKNCYNVGSVSVKDANGASAGAVAGIAATSALENCYFSENSCEDRIGFGTADVVIREVVGQTDSYMKSEAFVSKLNANRASNDTWFPWKIMGGSAYPQLLTVYAITDCEIGLSASSFTYDGTPKTPSVTVSYDGAALVEGRDYSVSYAANVDAGTGVVTVTGKGSYLGNKQLNFTIQKANQVISGGASSYEKTAGTKPFSLGVKLEKGISKLTYKTSNKKVVTVSNTGKVTIKGAGCAKITVTAKGTTNYNEAVKTCTIVVKPKKATIRSLKVLSGRKLQVNWKADTTVTGYMVEYATTSNFKNAKKAYVTGAKKTSTVLKGLAVGRKYYVRVSSYKEATVNGAKKKIFSESSKALLSGKIKK